LARSVEFDHFDHITDDRRSRTRRRRPRIRLNA